LKTFLTIDYFSWKRVLILERSSALQDKNFLRAF
jgi:hypothetical protein